MKTMIQKATLPTLATIAFCGLQTLAAPAPSDPIGEQFFPPELLIQARLEIGLTEVQLDWLRRKIEEVSGFDCALQRAGLIRREGGGIDRRGQTHPREAAGSLKVNSHVWPDLYRCGPLALDRRGRREGRRRKLGSALRFVLAEQQSNHRERGR
jgi:hypothetical protein